MNLQERINLLTRLGEYMLSDSESWTGAKERAHRENSWFLPEFIDRAAINIATAYLEKNVLTRFSEFYRLRATSEPSKNFKAKKIGIVMAGNIPLVGFHDLLCVFLTGQNALIKTSSKDDTLIKHLVNVMVSWNAEVAVQISFSEMLKVVMPILPRAVITPPAILNTTLGNTPILFAATGPQLLFLRARNQPTS
jgi:hypothetical protein